VSGRREALVVAVHDYEDPGLSKLRAPSHDAETLAHVLGHPEIGGFQVRQLRNEPAHVVNEALEEFFADRDRDDLLLVYFSGHGLKDEDGTLYLAAVNTKVRRLAATGVSASFVNQQMTRSRARRVVLILDCCYAGAFARGLTPRGVASDLGIEQQLGGCGRAVITSSSAMEYSFEGSRLTGGEAGAGPSVFTGVLVQGLESGAADRDGDGFVTLDEIYDYVYAGVRDITPHQTPSKWIFGLQGSSLHIARRPTGIPIAVTTSTPARRRRPPRWAVAGAATGLLAVVIPFAPLAWSQQDTSRPPKVSTAPVPGRDNATPDGVTLFHDDFTTRKGGWPNSSGTTPYGGYYKAGHYRYQSRQPGETWWSSPRAAAAVYPTAPSNIQVSAWARWSAPDDGAWFGLVCHAKGDDDAYIFDIAQGAAHIAKMKNRIYDELVGAPLHGVDLNTPVHLAAECATTNADHTTRLILRVNGSQVVEATDNKSPLENGTVGVTVEMSPEARPAEAEFTDFTVSRI